MSNRRNRSVSILAATTGNSATARNTLRNLGTSQTHGVQIRSKAGKGNAGNLLVIEARTFVIVDDQSKRTVLKEVKFQTLRPKRLYLKPGRKPDPLNMRKKSPVAKKHVQHKLINPQIFALTTFFKYRLANYYYRRAICSTD